MSEQNKVKVFKEKLANSLKDTWSSTQREHIQKLYAFCKEEFYTEPKIIEKNLNHWLEAANSLFNKEEIQDIAFITFKKNDKTEGINIGCECSLTYRNYPPCGGDPTG